MEVRVTPEEEARLTRIATQEGVDPAELLKDAALRLLEDDLRFRLASERALEQADRGEFIKEEEMDARVKRMFQPWVREANPPRHPNYRRPSSTKNSSNYVFIPAHRKSFILHGLLYCPRESQTQFTAISVAMPRTYPSSLRSAPSARLPVAQVQLLRALRAAYASTDIADISRSSHTLQH